MKKLVLVGLVLMVLAALGAQDDKDLVVSESAEVKAGAEQVWSLLINVSKWPSWNPVVAEAGIVSGDAEKEKSQIYFVPIINGKKTPTKMKMTLVKSKKPELYEFTSHSAGMDLIFGFKIEEKDGKRIVTSYETIKYPSSKVYIALYGADSLRKNHRVWADAIKKAVDQEPEGSGK